MTEYAVVVGDREYRVAVQPSGLLVDGEPLDFELTSLNGNGLHLFRRGVRHIEMYFKSVTSRDAAPGVAEASYEVQVHGQATTARVDALHARRRARGASREDAAEAGAITAPMPGLVVELMVEPGQEVLQGDVLLTQESMKMQMQLRAPFTGRVVEVAVEAGAQVEKGAVLVRLAADAERGGM